MKNLYLALAILGAVIPYAFFISHFVAEGLSLPIFLATVFANPAAGGMTADLFISSFIFWLMMWRVREDRGGPALWPFILLNLGIGLSCALPAYLYAAENAKTAAV